MVIDLTLGTAPNYGRRKVVVAASSVAFIGASGCAGDIKTNEIEASRKERHAFISNAMKDLREKVDEENRRTRSQGVEAAMRVSALIPFGDWDYYYLKGGTILWRPNQGQTYRPVEVPEGFVSDLTSVPRLFWQVLRPEGRYAYAAVVHDFLYWTQTRSREEADNIFLVAMEDSKVDPVTAKSVHQAVRSFGDRAWEKNSELRSKGEKRILKRFPDDLTVSWNAWKSTNDVFK
jgi:hypothetical protein